MRQNGRRRARWRPAAAALLLLAGLAGARAEVTPDAELPRAEFERVSREIALSKERMESLAAEISAVKRDHASVTAALIQSAKTESKLAEDIEEIAERLETMKARQAVLRAGLGDRRDVLAEVLGALERMGLNPPPAILVRPEDALASVRSAILLGAVVPQLRSQTEELVADLERLGRVAAAIEAERQRLADAVGEQLAEKQRLALLLEEKDRLQGEREAALAEEQQRSEELARRAGSLKELIAALERQAEAAAAARARQAERDRRQTELAALPVPESNQLAAPRPFSARRDAVALPVTGRFKRRFGGSDGNGGVMLGDTLATQSGAIVTAPADGEVLYAGPFRSYGQLLILNAGDGYHIVLAGMSRINVALGQSVLSGEPVGAMGGTMVASTAANAPDSVAPELYVEFRKDGKPVDPSPWWADRRSGRTGNGT